MPQRLSELFSVSQANWDATGAFDAFVGVDARLHIDPHLLATSRAPELDDARSRFDSHFTDVIKLLRSADSSESPFYMEAVRRLTFREIPNTGLGYSKGGKRGSGIGPKLAADIAKLGKAIVDAGFADPDIFALMGLLQDKVGADRISDMTAQIIVPSLFRFTERVVRDLRLPTRRLVLGNRSYDVPIVSSTGEIVVFTPRDILRHLPVAESWYDIDVVASHNAQLRNRVNAMIGSTWKHAATLPKWRLREALLRHPELIRDLLDQYKEKPAKPYDLNADPQMLHLWQPITRSTAASHPLRLSLTVDATQAETVSVVRALLRRFKELVEDNRLYRLFYNDDGSPRREKAAQLALFGIADAYCAANDIALNPETDSGNGPVDFKFGRGYAKSVLAEVKLSSSSKLLSGFATQVAAYESAEKADHAFYVVVRIDDRVGPLNRLFEAHNSAKEQGKRCPELIVIDARPTLSASKR